MQMTQHPIEKALSRVAPLFPTEIDLDLNRIKQLLTKSHFFTIIITIIR